MELSGARTLVVGGTGVLGGKVVQALHEAGARFVVTGRSADRLAALAAVAEATVELDLLDVAACREAVVRAADTFGGLDLVVVASGVAGFGSASETPDAVTEELFAVNALGPIAVLSAAVPVMSGGLLVTFSAILADAPMAQMAAYSASKAALSAYLTALRREVRRAGIGVLDVRAAAPGDRARRPRRQRHAADASRGVRRGRVHRAARRGDPIRGQGAGLGRRRQGPRPPLVAPQVGVTRLICT